MKVWVFKVARLLKARNPKKYEFPILPRVLHVLPTSPSHISSHFQKSLQTSHIKSYSNISPFVQIRALWLQVGADGTSFSLLYSNALHKLRSLRNCLPLRNNTTYYMLFDADFDMTASVTQSGGYWSVWQIAKRTGRKHDFYVIFRERVATCRKPA
jgi:hypothetical protein